ncbi:transposase [Methylobacterium sp. WL103]|nr:transposase [Methylobacterium sp. WL103]
MSIVRGVRFGTPGPSALRAHGPQGNTVGFASSWLHPLKSWSLRKTRCGSQLPGVPKWVVRDRGYARYAFREHIWDMGARPAIPPQRHEAPFACPDWISSTPNQVERLWPRLKEWSAIAILYEKTAVSFMGVLSLATALDWLKR